MIVKKLMLTTSQLSSISITSSIFFFIFIQFLIKPISTQTAYAQYVSSSSLLQSQNTTWPTKILNLSVTAVQNQNQIFFSYLPYIGSCDYNQPNIIQGNFTIELLDSNILYEQNQYENMMVFWSPVKNGLSIMALLNQLLQQQSGKIRQYDGYILYDSKIRQFHRSIIFYTLNQTNLTFYYAIPTLSLHNMILDIKIINITNVNLNQQSQQILLDCQNITSINYTNFIYLGSGNYMFTCGQIQKGFIFVPKNINQTGNVIDFSQIGSGKYLLSANPYLLIAPNMSTQLEHWNCIILSQNITDQSQLSFFIYDFQSGNYTILQLTQMESQLSLLIDRIWGLQIKKQFSRWMDIASDYNFIGKGIFFPGDVVSVFVSDHDNVYVESATQKGINYLCVFGSTGQLYWNISYVGSVVYYGTKAIFIYDKNINKIYFIQIDRPIYTLETGNIKNTTVGSFYNFYVNLTCHNQILALNYTLMWTTPQYPSTYVAPRDTSQLISNDIIYGFQAKSRFQIIGPDFQLIVNAPPTIQTIIIDSSTIIINQLAINIMDIQFANGKSFTVIYATNNTIYSINSHKQVQTLSVQPCGFTSISSTSRSSNGNFIITNQQNIQCSCTSDFQMCKIISFGEMYGMLNMGYNNNNNNNNKNYGQYHRQKSQWWKKIRRGTTYDQFMNSLDSQTIFGAPNVPIKRNLYGMVKDGYIVSILQNNTALLIDIQNLQVLDRKSFKCQQQNSTNGDIYIRQFYDPFLILFCQQTSTLYQFIIRTKRMIPRRQIPLYNFKTRSGLYTFFPAFSYIFISVDPLVQIYPMPNNCCVLRLDPCQNTVSVIAQIINAQSVIVVTTYRNVDIALFKSNGGSSSTCIIQLYFPDIWITLNQTNHTSIVSNGTIYAIYQSMNYNFAASFQLNYTINLTNINLNLTYTPSKKYQIANLTLNFNKTIGSRILFNSTNYNLSKYLCGPVFNSVFYRTNNNLPNLQIIQTDVLARKKMLGKIGIQFIQLINPDRFGVANLSLNQLIFAISVQQMFVYGKVINGVQMKQIINFTLPQKSCTYYLYNVINQTAATLNSNCEGINYDFKQPLLTVNYDPNTYNFTHSSSWMISPLALRQIYTIVRPENQTTLVLGILQGPMNSETGRLYLCDGDQCSALFISTTDSFLLNYAVKINNSLYTVMSIDYQTIQVFINPQVQQNDTKIFSNYTFMYSNYINQPYCSVIKILKVTQTFAYSLLSCFSFYYRIKMFFTSETIQILQRFARYAQCNLQDQFKPITITDQDGQLKMMFAQCKQNDYTFKLQTYETINTSYPIIYTGFLQVFSINGPLGPNCSNDSISPSKVIPISTSMQYPQYMTYTIPGPNNTAIYKFLYSQINGILIDNLVSLNSTLQIRYSPFSLQYSNPTIQFYAANQFHSVNQSVFTNLVIPPDKDIIYYIIFGLYALANTITLVCLICYLCQKNHKENGLKTQIRDSTALGGVQQLQYQDNLKNVFDFAAKETGNPVPPRKTTTTVNKNRPSEIQMFFVKKK